ncbi:hypothetical protein, partial [Klebsiella aerogenes]|uniref:hypothetical protein n=1 Tax=Klebsiella aerogenes TaxID=548 RepID=UPI001CBF53B5
KAFLTTAFDGPPLHGPDELKQWPGPLTTNTALERPHFERIADILRRTLAALLIDEEAIHHVMAAVEAHRRTVFGGGA